MPFNVILYLIKEINYPKINKYSINSQINLHKLKKNNSIYNLDLM
jgi:hypothetical protein